MSLIKRRLSTIIGTFTKTLNELDAFCNEQDKRKDIAISNRLRLLELDAVQANIIADSRKQYSQALSVRNKIAALIE